MDNNDGGDGSYRRRHTTLPVLSLKNLKVISAVGRGAKGVVFLVKNDDAFSECFFALKVISKALIYKKEKALYYDRSECRRVSFEQQVLRRFNHPLLPRLQGVLETQTTVGYAIDYCPGGNFHSLRKKQPENKFSHDSIRFYAMELVLALEYLHNLGIVYRDLKPDNIMIQVNGHIMLVDFDLSKKLNPKSPGSLSYNSSPRATTEKQTRNRRFSRFFSCYNSGIFPYDSDINSVRRSESDSVEKANSFVGTEEYVAPEVILGKGHNFGVDWWSLGVVLYEMLYGKTPFRGENRKDSFHRILTKEPELTGETTPLKDLIGRLLEKDPDRRIEADGIKGHDFFKGVKWDKVLQIRRPPYIPENEVEEREGFKKIDVELFVHGIFFGKKGEGEKNKAEGEKERAEKPESKRECVEKLSKKGPETENFSSF